MLLQVGMVNIVWYGKEKKEYWEKDSVIIRQSGGMVGREAAWVG